jgi:hypothetical protein
MISASAFGLGVGVATAGSGVRSLPGRPAETHFTGFSGSAAVATFGGRT